MFRPVLLLAAAVAALTATQAALAQGPVNDNRANAQRLGAPPVSVGGSTVGATREVNDPGGCAAPPTPSGTGWTAPAQAG
jgi:hypothetical protein